MTNPRYWLLSEPIGVSAAEVGRRTGTRTFDTPMGIMIEAPPDPVVEAICIGFQLDVINCALNPPAPRCCRGVVLHERHCKFWNVVV